MSSPPSSSSSPKNIKNRKINDDHIIKPDCLQLCFMLGICSAILLGGGLSIGVQSYFGGLETRGFCSEKCSSNETINNIICDKQRICLAEPVNLGASLLNVMAFIFGLLGDVLGGAIGFALGSLICCFAPLLFAIDPENGTGYSIAVPLWASGCAISFFTVVPKLIPKHISPSRVALAISAYQCSWDLALSLTPLIDMLLRSATSWSVLEVFLAVGMASAPSVIAVWCILFYETYFNKNRSSDDTTDDSSENVVEDDEKTVLINNNNNNTNDQQENDENENEEKQQESFFRVAHRVIANRRFFALACGAVSTVTYGYFVMSNVGLLAASHGASIDQEHDFERNTGYIMGVLGAVVGLSMGALIDHSGPKWRQSCRLVAIVQATLLAACVILVSIKTISWQVQYLTFCFVTAWRMLGFAGINAFWCKAMAEKNDTAATGLGLGLLFSFGGICSIIVGRIGTERAQEGDFIEVHMIIGLVCVVLHVIQIVFAYDAEQKQDATYLSVEE